MRSSAVLLLATVCGVAVGNVYFPQATGPAIAAGLHVSGDAAAAVVTATQLGYAAGLFLLVPLGDRLPHRRLLMTLLAVTGTLLLIAGLMPALRPLVALSVLIGTATVAAPIIGPMVAGLVPPDRRGVTGGLLLSGGTGGMLLSRTFSGYLAEWWGWAAPYLLFGVLTLALVPLAGRVVPRTGPGTRRPYPALLIEPLRLLRREPLLRRSAGYQAAVFAGFSAVWTCVALLLTGPAYGYDAHAAGLLALVNVVTVIVTPFAGRLADRRGPDLVTLICAAAVLVAAALLSLGGGGRIGWLIAGTLVLDVAMQSGTVANQVRFYALGPGRLSRMNTAYMTCAYLGGAIGSWLGVRCFTAYGWKGVCGLVALLAATVVLTGWRRLGYRRGRRVVLDHERAARH
ncbi:MFS transporter [Actinoplanes utahensis]|uniref:MFS transporter n=1 Tax=Actinoplanes utahensis TaxID=1869 RepID=UPI0007C7C0D7|nr:MFS transporter [Actinoplanes utahensis]GIF30805.1 MFS transporter [Actinoplanes utahensis]